MLTASLLLSFLFLPVFAQDADVLGQARDHLRRGHLAEAGAVLSQALDAGVGDEHALRLALADVQIRSGDADAALDTLATLDGSETEVAMALGRAYTARADALAAGSYPAEDVDAALAEAMGHLEQAVVHGASGAPVWELGQFLLYRYNDLDGALALAEEALAAHPDDGEALLLRGAAGAWVYWNASQAGDVEGANQAWSAAVADLEKANETLDHDRLEPLGQLIFFYEAQDISGIKAVDTAKRIVDRQPDPDFSLLFRLARKYRDSGRFEASGKALEAIVSMSARDLTQLIRDSDEPDKVASRLSASIDPYYQRGDKATCRSILAAIVAAEPRDPLVWDNYAVICQETARYDDAVTAYEHKIQLAPDDPRTYNDLGAIYQHFLRRDTDKAKTLYEKCIDMANQQLAMLDLDPALKQNASEAKGFAEDNMRQLSPAGGGKSLLDSMVSGLRGLNLPKGDDAKEPEGGESGGEGDGGEGS